MATAGAEYKKLSLDVDEDENADLELEELYSAEVPQGESRRENADQLQRQLDNRQIQLIAIGGSLGTALFVSISDPLRKGGPGSLLIAFVLQSLVVACVNNSVAEMSVLCPVSGGFIRMAGKWVDEALGFMVGYNFFIYQALLIPFEITALNLVLSFWSDDIPVALVCGTTTVCYALLNILAVRTYGEAEFWLSGGKFILICILFLFTLITSIGLNPKHDAYGFRNWRTPGAFAEYLSTGSLGQFEGFLACVWAAAFTVAGPEYLAMVAAEAKRPRTYLKRAFETVYLRFGIFFIGGAICAGMVIPSNDPQLVALLSSTTSETVAASPYVIAMSNLGITALPHLVNALLITSIFSAGNTYTYCATRSLYGLALEGRAPRVLRTCTASGVPIACFGIVICFPLLSFLAITKGSAQVLAWLVSLVTAGGLINYIVISITYLRFYYACRLQGVDRSSFPYVGRFQPFCGWVGAICMSIICMFYGYTAFQPPNAVTFFFHYTMVIVDPILFIVWKVLKRTSMVPLREVDLIWERPIIDAYEASLTTPPVSFWGEVRQLFRSEKTDLNDDPAPVTDESAIPMLNLENERTG